MHPPDAHERQLNRENVVSTEWARLVAADEKIDATTAGADAGTDFMNAASTLPTSEPGLQADQRLVDRGWLRIGAAAAVAGQAMVFSLAINLSEIEGWAYAVVHGILIASALGTLAFLGGDLMRSAWESVRDRKMSIDLLFLVTLGGALAGSLVCTFTHTGSVYYEVVAILVVVHTLGKMLGARSRVAALRAVDDTREKFEFCDEVQVDGSVKRQRAAEIAEGARVRVAPGGAIAVDGVILQGRGYVQETSMTGEWRPVPRGSGDRVWAGTFSVDGSFEIRASGGLRKLDGILAGVSAARLAPSRLQQQADRLIAWFLPLVVGVSLATFVGWLACGPWEQALFNAMAVLLVACPCAMGLATPVAVWGGLARLAKIGLEARSCDFLDVLSRLEHVCIDKTGTLSSSTLAVRAWQVEPEFAPRETWLRAAVAALEEGLAHPVAVALQEKCHVLRDTFPQVLKVANRQIVPGQGVVAEVSDGFGGRVRLAVGETTLGMSKNAAEKDVASGEGGQSDKGECHVLRDTFSRKEIYVFVEGKRAATVELAESWREGMVEMFAALSGQGIEVEVLSGDPSAVVALSSASIGGVSVPHVSNALCYKPDRAGGRDVVRGGMTPAEKVRRVEELVTAGRVVLFVGDGINDAAAMSVAQGSIAMRGGAALARASAMAVFAGEDLRFLPRSIAVARMVRRSIRTNLFFAAAYNGLGMALAAAGWLHPVAAALLMLGSSAFVSVKALRAGREQPVSASF